MGLHQNSGDSSWLHPLSFATQDKISAFVCTFAMELPVVCAVSGAAIGAVCDLTLMCDVRIAGEHAKFAESFAKLRIVPGDGGAWLLPRVVGWSQACEVALTGDLVDAEEAKAIGLVSLDRADEVFEQTGTVLPEARMERTLRKLDHLQKEAVRYRSIEQRMDQTGETQVSLSDPDARSMATTARMPRIVGYNVQTVVEADHHLIVAHEVTMLGFDRDALSMMCGFERL